MRPLTSPYDLPADGGYHSPGDPALAEEQKQMILYETPKRYSGTSKSKRPGLCRSICCRETGSFLVFSFWGRTLRSRPARSDGSGQRLQCRRPSSGKWAASGSGWRQTGCRPAPALHCVPDAGSIHAAACSLQTARLKAAPGSGWGRWSGPFAAGNRCIPFFAWAGSTRFSAAGSNAN